MKNIDHPASPLVSVLMPAYNAELYITQSIASQLAQTYENWELLVADDGSTDSTRQLIDHFKDYRIKRFHQSVNRGYLKTWNHLLSKAGGHYITFLDADDYIHQDRTKFLADFLNENPEVDLCGTSIAFVNENGRVLRKRLYPLNWQEIQEGLYNPVKFPFCGSAVMVRRQVAETVGGYRPFFDRVGWEDHDWLIRCCERFEAANLPEALYYYRENLTSVSRSFDNSPDSIRKLVIKKIGLDLAHQRKQFGHDYLTDSDLSGINALIEKHEDPFQRDSSLIYRILSGRALSEGDAESGLAYSVQSVRRKPFYPSNYLTVFRSLKALIFK